MARTFVAASSQKLVAASVPRSTTPLTIAALVRPTAAGLTGIIVAARAAATSQGFYLRLSANKVQAQEFDGTTNAFATGVTAFTAGTWAHAAAVWDGSNNFCYKDGVQDGTVVASAAPTGVDTFEISSASQFFDGDIAECAVWNVALTVAELASLAAGVSPALVRPSALVSYWPLVGTTAPEIDPKGRDELTVTGATAGAHPRMIYGADPVLVRFGTAAAATAGQGRMFAVF